MTTKKFCVIIYIVKLKKQGGQVLNIIIISIKNKDVERYLLKHMDKWGKDINPMLDNIYINRNILQERFFPVLNILCKNDINRNLFILDSSDKLNIQEYQKNLPDKYNYFLIYSPTEAKSTLLNTDTSIFNKAVGKITYNGNLFCSKKNNFWEKR